MNPKFADWYRQGMKGYYTLNGREPVLVSAEEFWSGNAGMLDPKQRQVGRTKVGKVVVSTVFLQFDHQWRPGAPPVLFETMVFGGEHDQAQERYCTWVQAEAGHQRWIAKVQESAENNTQREPKEH